MKNNHGQWLTAWYLEDTFWVLQACLLCTFQTLSEHLLNTQIERVLQRGSRGAPPAFDLHMLIVPFRYLFGTLLVPKVATGMPSIKWCVLLQRQVGFRTACAWCCCQLMLANKTWLWYLFCALLAPKKRGHTNTAQKTRITYLGGKERERERERENWFI